MAAGKKGAPPGGAPAAAAAAPWACEECGEADNDASSSACAACDAPRPAPAVSVSPADDDDPLSGLLVGLVLSSAPVAGKDKLHALCVDVGRDAPLSVVTNAANAAEGARVVVAPVGASLRSGGDVVVVKKQAVGGVVSEGVLCDAPALGWTGGGAGAAALVPASFAIGSRPPASRPRMDGK